ncbi:MAG: ethanolamine ammonia-lyase reactivating factor EutA, partial [Thiovulaceae bacterium]|nr:ethanolamine ammonia-lyase reactivating factor EutA [Sulfurimonadaceae bacterium]
MAKRTAIIDIGSNSVRIVIYEKTSRFAFHLLREAKSRVRIGEGAYLKDGYLQEEAMQRAYETVEEFVSLAHAYKCRKILSVATSALRDAPNKKDFLNKVSKNLNLNIRIIDGNEEAYLGGIAVANMLPDKNGVTIDIGGGSTELAYLENGLVTDTISLDIGTVRLKELFCDAKRKDEAINFIANEANKIPKKFHNCNVIGIG